MSDLVRKMPWPGEDPGESEPLLTREWLVTNGLGGYASGTVSGVITRGFHGYLIAALPAPLGRMMMLNDLVEQVTLPDEHTIPLNAADFPREFRMQEGLPVWRYRLPGFIVEK